MGCVKIQLFCLVLHVDFVYVDLLYVDLLLSGDDDRSHSEGGTPVRLLSPTSVKSSPVSPNKHGDVPPPADTPTPPAPDGRGPRIKHVCRKAAVVLGKPVATFPSAAEFRLSALPKQEKVKILKDEKEKAGTVDVVVNSSVNLIVDLLSSSLS